MKYYSSQENKNIKNHARKRQQGHRKTTANSKPSNQPSQFAAKGTAVALMETRAKPSDLQQTHWNLGFKVVVEARTLKYAERVISPVHPNVTLGYMQSKISEQRTRCCQRRNSNQKTTFSNTILGLRPFFVPLVNLWTMCFESEPGFFQRIVRQTGSLRNILMIMASQQITACISQP